MSTGVLQNTALEVHQAQLGHTAQPSALLARDFWTNLTAAVDELKESLPEDEVDGASEHQQHGITDALFPAARVSNEVYRPGDHDDHIYGWSHDELYNLYGSRFHPLFMVLHWPTVRDALHKPDGDLASVALKGAILFGAACTVLPHESQDLGLLVALTKSRAEISLASAGLLTSSDVQVLQAFLIYLAGLRACQANAQQWTLLPLAIRIASAFQIPRVHESMPSSYTSQMGRRIWYCIGILDLQAAFDRGTRPLLSSKDFLEPPLDVNEVDLLTKHLKGPSHTFTDSSTSQLIYQAVQCQHRLIEAQSQSPNSSNIRAQQAIILADFEATVTTLKQLTSGPESAILHHFTIAIANESLLTMRLLVHRPLQLQPLTSDDIDVLATAKTLLDSAAFKKSPEFMQWSWFRWTKWFALAIVLAELITRSPPWDEATWTVAQSSFDSYAHLVADGDRGLLWKPVANLMLRARAKVRAYHDELGQAVQESDRSGSLEDEPWLDFVIDCSNMDAMDELDWDQWLRHDQS